MRNFLLDNWSVSGSSIPDFSAAIADAKRYTHIVKKNLDDFKVLSRVDSPEYPDSLVFYYLDKDAIRELRENGRIPKKRMRLEDVIKTPCLTEDFDKFLQENSLTTKLMLIDNQNRLYFVSQGALATLSLRTKCGGDWFFNQSLSRDIAIAEVMSSAIDTVTVNYCEVGGVRKILSFCTEKYAEVPLTILTDIINKIVTGDTEMSPATGPISIERGRMGRIDCKWWSLSHRFAEIYIEFPDVAADIQATYGLPNEIVPGLYLATSDTADSSLFIRSTYRGDNGKNLSYVVSDEVQVIHKGSINLKKVMEAVDSRIFGKFLAFPEQLATLIMKEATPAALDLTTKNGQKRNHEIVMDRIKSVFKAVGMVGAISKKNEKVLIEQISCEINPEIAYTEYDIAMLIMDLPERLEGLDRKRETLFKKACADTVPVMAANNYVTKQEDILLTA